MLASNSVEAKVSMGFDKVLKHLERTFPFRDARRAFAFKPSSHGDFCPRVSVCTLENL